MDSSDPQYASGLPLDVLRAFSAQKGMDQAKVDTAVHAAIAHCGTGADRFVRLDEYVAMLEANPLWDQEEIASLKGRVARLVSWTNGEQRPL